MPDLHDVTVDEPLGNSLHLLETKSNGILAVMLPAQLLRQKSKGLEL